MVPRILTTADVYLDMPFPLMHIALKEARSLGSIGAVEHEWVCTKPLTREQVFEKLNSKGTIVYESVHPSDASNLNIVFNYKVGESYYPVAFSVEKARARIMVAFVDKDKGMEVYKDILSMFPMREPRKDAAIVKVDFWVRSSMGGPKKTTRDIEVIPLENTLGNYDEKTKALLEDLSKYKPTKGGQILLFTGVPGTGKTHAIRSLLWAWREWADFHYVVDPNALFGDSPDYMMKVIFNEFDDDHPMRNREEDAEELMKWKIVILEDAGELVRVDAKTTLRQGMAQLLNLTDGMLGQGLKLIFLITTNEEISKLDAAISRPGRCAVRQEFMALTKVEANEWLKVHGLAEDATESMTIAQLYAKLDGSEKRLGFNPTPIVRTVGFTNQ